MSAPAPTQATAMIDVAQLVEVNNWLLTVYGEPFASAAAAITVLLTICYLIASIRRWTANR
jgi:hypothetical protein